MNEANLKDIFEKTANIPNVVNETKPKIFDLKTYKYS